MSHCFFYTFEIREIRPPLHCISYLTENLEENKKENKIRAAVDFVVYDGP